MLHRVRLPQELSFPRMIAVALVLTSLLVGRAVAQAQVDEAGEERLGQLINEERSSHGLGPLAVDHGLTQAARKHTERMLEHKALSHQFDGEPALQLRFADENVHSDQQAENLALGDNVISAHHWLMLSPDHRASILNANYNTVGVAVLRSGDHVYVTEDFAHSYKAYSEPEADAALQRAVESYTKGHGMPAPARKPQSRLR